jgi:hypothetical protein
MILPHRYIRRLWNVEAGRLPPGKAEEFLKKYKVKSMVAIPIVYAKTFLGMLVLNFIKKERHF